jgi:hypothetical protein
MEKVVILLPDTDVQLLSDVKSGKVVAEERPAQSSLLLSNSSSGSFPLTQSAAGALWYLGRFSFQMDAGLGSTAIFLPGGTWYGLHISTVSQLCWMQGKEL